MLESWRWNTVFDRMNSTHRISPPLELAAAFPAEVHLAFFISWPPMIECEAIIFKNPVNPVKKILYLPATVTIA